MGTRFQTPVAASFAPFAVEVPSSVQTHGPLDSSGLKALPKLSVSQSACATSRGQLPTRAHVVPWSSGWLRRNKKRRIG
ncbi:hypothetical protein PsYK624_123200 [Phanerochaete sordida]|uniref:Uncharacterized protein n=1 Tax=Phanerochaete sordida TaxID=48140 RepID=A0A9P3GIC8_9APHY|nr:hypothetical protein PsYK624_123200 [Phanerochaete sordida]